MRWPRYLHDTVGTGAPLTRQCIRAVDPSVGCCGDGALSKVMSSKNQNEKITQMSIKLSKHSCKIRFIAVHKLECDWKDHFAYYRWTVILAESVRCLQFRHCKYKSQHDRFLYWADKVSLLVNFLPVPHKPFYTDRKKIRSLRCNKQTTKWGTFYTENGRLVILLKLFLPN